MATGTTERERLPAVEGLQNLRDLGGYALTGGAITRWRSVLRGDAVCGLDARAQDRLIEHGLRTVIDLRTPGEIADQPNSFAGHARVDYLNISLFAALAPVNLLASDAGSYNMAARYRDAIDRCGGAIAAVLTAVAEARDETVLVHCTAGKDRTGIIAALLLLHAGAEPEAVVEDYARTANAAALLRILRQRGLDRGTPATIVDRMLASAPGTMRETIAHIRDAHGGISAYVDALGLSTAARQSLTRRLVDRHGLQE